MSNRNSRLPYSLTRSGGFYKIRSNLTNQIVSGPISNKKRDAVKVLLNYANTDRFVKFTQGPTTVRNLMKVFGGRLRPKQTPWTLEEARLLAVTYKTRTELYQNSPLYIAAQKNGWLNEICSHMPPPPKRYTYGVVNPNKVLAEVFKYKTYGEFASCYAYNLLRRAGIDTQELFDNRDNVEYLRKVILELSQDNAARFVA